MPRITKAELEERIKDEEKLVTKLNTQIFCLLQEKDGLRQERDFLRQCIAGLIMAHGPAANTASGTLPSKRGAG